MSWERDSLFVGEGEFAPVVWQHPLPLPPSINHYYRSIFKGKFPQQIISKQGRAFRKRCMELLEGEEPLGEGRYAVEMRLHAPDRRKRDLDNRVKPTLDALVHAGIIPDDERFDRVTIERGEVHRPGMILVHIARLEE